MFNYKYKRSKNLNTINQYYITIKFTHINSMTCDGFIISNNCHKHVSDILTKFGYHNSRFNQCKVWLMLLLRGKYVNMSSCILTYLPFIIISSVFVGITLLYQVYN